MLDPALLAFLGLSALLTVTPGADMALLAAKVLRHGPRAAMVASAGILLGLFVHATASAVGLSALLAQSATAFTIVKWAGAAYLAYLGIQALRSAGRGPAPGPAEPAAARVDERRHFLHGLLSNVLNPKVALFYLLVVPQFIPAGAPVFEASMGLALMHIAMGVVWLPVYVLLVTRLVARAKDSRLGTWLERATGGAMIALGARLALQRGAGASA